jgi:rSAM/selenodomain-associated transferase 2
MNSISIVIPVYNEAKSLHSFLVYLQKMNSNNIIEFLVVDGGSSDGSKSIVSTFSKKNLKFKSIESPKGRAIQMNIGAAQALGGILYFLHADSLPPEKYDEHIIEAVSSGAKSGCFRMKFDSQHWGLKVAGWLTQFNSKSCRGGDQSLYVEKTLFEQIKGYNESFLIYEDNEIINKLYKQSNFKVIQKWLTTSARRYNSNGIWRLQFHFVVIHLKKYLGANAKKLESYYLNHIK